MIVGVAATYYLLNRRRGQPAPQRVELPAPIPFDHPIAAGKLPETHGDKSYYEMIDETNVDSPFAAYDSLAPGHLVYGAAVAPAVPYDSETKVVDKKDYL